MTTEAKKRLSDHLVGALTALGELPEGTIRDRLLSHVLEARNLADQLHGQGPVRNLDSGPMISRMS